jgi:hypothetical protein
MISDACFAGFKRQFHSHQIGTTSLSLQTNGAASMPAHCATFQAYRSLDLVNNDLGRPRELVDPHESKAVPQHVQVLDVSRPCLNNLSPLDCFGTFFSLNTITSFCFESEHI